MALSDNLKVALTDCLALKSDDEGMDKEIS